MYAPIFPLTFAFVVFAFKQPEDKPSYTGAYSERKYNYDCQREPVNQVRTERIVCQRVHETRFSAYRICCAGSFNLASL